MRCSPNTYHISYSNIISMSDSLSSNKRIAKNTMFLYIRMFFVLLVSLYTSRVILNTLGVEDFGVYNVVSGFVSLFGFLNATLSQSMQRFYNFYLGNDGDVGVKMIYSTGLIIHAIICVFLLLTLETFGLWYINNVLVVPDERLFAANIVFQTTVFSMLLIVLQIPFVGAVLAYEKMNFYSFVSILEVVLKLVIVLVLPYFPYDKLIGYSIFLLSISIGNTLLYVLYSKNTIHSLAFKLSIDRVLLKNMLNFSGWNLLGTFAFMINGQGLNMLLNAFFGPVVNAARGVSFQVSSAVSSFSGSITTAFRPQVVDSYARGNDVRVKKLFYIENKVCFNLILLLTVPILMEIDQILRLWLGDAVPEQTSLFTILVLLNTLICATNPIVGQVAFATGNIKRYQIANSLVNILVIPVAYFLLTLGMSATSVFIVTIVFSVFNQIVCLVELNRLFRIDITKYVQEVILPCLIVVVLSFLPQIVIHYFLPETFLRFVISGLTEILVSIPMFYVFVLNKEERKVARNAVATLVAKL